MLLEAIAVNLDWQMSKAKARRNLQVFEDASRAELAVLLRQAIMICLSLNLQ